MLFPSRCAATHSVAAALITLASVLLMGCASTSSDSSKEKSDSSPMPAMVTLELERGPVGLALREISQIYSISVVLMNGLELAQTGPHSFRERRPESIVREISRDLGYEIYEAPHYLFVFAPGYEALIEVNVEGRLASQTAKLRADVAFGSDTPLYSGLALMGHTLGHTFIADNAVAEALCGELRLRDVPIAAALTAMLQSARVNAASFRIESTADYTFLSSMGNVSGRRYSGDKASLSEGERALLLRRVSLMLPHREDDPRHIQGRLGASTLGEVLPEISAQLGVPVTADRNMLRLPLNPMVMTMLPIETAMDLIIRQWLVPEFVYEVDGEGIRLRHVPATQ